MEVGVFFRNVVEIVTNFASSGIKILGIASRDLGSFFLPLKASIQKMCVLFLFFWYSELFSVVFPYVRFSIGQIRVLSCRQDLAGNHGITSNRSELDRMDESWDQLSSCFA